MRRLDSHKEAQRPPWRSSPPLHEDSEEDEAVAAEAAAAMQFNHRSSPLTASPLSPTRPLRPPPLFRPDREESDIRRLTAVAGPPARVRHDDGKNRHLHPTAEEAFTSAASAMHVPVSHWRRGTATSTGAPPAVALNSTSETSTNSLDHGTENGATRGEPGWGQRYPVHRELGARSNGGRDGEGRKGECHDRDIDLYSAGVTEHYHVRELEEQLQYWRQRALQTEGQSLRRERAIKAKYAADFAAAQATSETVIRQLLDKQHRLQHQQQEQLRQLRRQRVEMAEARGASSQTVSALSRSTSASSLASHDASAVSCSHREVVLAGNHAHKTQRKSSSSKVNSEKLAPQGGVALDDLASLRVAEEAREQLRELQQRVKVLTRENAALSAALATKQDEQRDAGVASENVLAAQRHEASSADSSHSEGASSHTCRLSTALISKERALQKMSDAQARTLAAPKNSETAATAASSALPTAVTILAEALLRCVEHGAELRRHCATINPIKEDYNDAINKEEKASTTDSALADEKRHHEQIKEQLCQVLQSVPRGNIVEPDSAATATIAERLPHQLASLHSAAEHVDFLLLNCVDDLVVMRSQREREAAAQVHQQHHQQQQQQKDGNEERGIATLRASLHSLQEAHTQHTEEHARELHALHAAAAQQQHRHSTLEAELSAARRVIAELREEQKATADALRAGEERAHEVNVAHATALAQMQDSFAQDMLDAARRVSTAEHECHLLTEREGQWRTRLAAASAARDAYAQECAVLKRRQEILQLRTTDPSNGLTKEVIGGVGLASVRRAFAGTEADAATNEVRDSQRKLSSRRSTGEARPPAVLAATTLRTFLQQTSSVSPAPRDALSTEGSDPACRSAMAATESEAKASDERARRDMHQDAATPRRSLSYSPPESAEKAEAALLAPKVTGSAAWADAEKAYRADLMTETAASGANEPYRSDNKRGATAAPRSAPVLVAQPSILAEVAASVNKGVENADEREAANGSAGALQQRWKSASSPADGDINSTPLARMRAWEEKFKSILTPA